MSRHSRPRRRGIILTPPPSGRSPYGSPTAVPTATRESLAQARAAVAGLDAARTLAAAREWHGEAAELGQGLTVEVAP